MTDKRPKREPEGAISKSLRIGKGAILGGIGGRALAYHPVTGGAHLNRATIIGAAAGAGIQAAANHLVDHGSRQTEEVKRVRRSLGGLPATGIAIAGIAKAASREQDFNDEVASAHRDLRMRQGLNNAFSFTGKPKQAMMHESTAAKIHEREGRLMRGENLFVPRFGRQAGSGSGVVTYDDSSKDRRSNLEKMAKSNSPHEAATAKRALKKMRGGSVIERAKKLGRSVIAKARGMMGGKGGARTVAGLLR